MSRVRVVGLPRPHDPEAQRQLWVGMELSVVEPDPGDPMSQISGRYLWVNYEEVISQLVRKGDRDYADFFHRLRRTPGGSQAPGLLIERDVCQEI